MQVGGGRHGGRALGSGGLVTGYMMEAVGEGQDEVCAVNTDCSELNQHCSDNRNPIS